MHPPLGTGSTDPPNDKSWHCELGLGTFGDVTAGGAVAFRKSVQGRLGFDHGFQIAQHMEDDRQRG
jgi:hypothetical protein